jgi:hypothetical protein
MRSTSSPIVPSVRLLVSVLVGRRPNPFTRAQTGSSEPAFNTETTRPADRRFSKRVVRLHGRAHSYRSVAYRRAVMHSRTVRKRALCLSENAVRATVPHPRTVLQESQAKAMLQAAAWVQAGANRPRAGRLNTHSVQRHF